MTEVTIQHIEANYDAVLELVGQDSFVNWEGFIKSSTQLKKQAEDLVKQLAIFRDVQQRRFVATMKQLKGYDIPDLIKTVKAKKLPRQTLKAILPRLKFEGEKLVLVEPVENLRAESKKAYDQYFGANEALQNKFKQASALLQVKIVESGILNEVATEAPKELVSTFKHSFDEKLLEAAASNVQLQYLPGTVDTLHIKTYAQIVENCLNLVKTEFKRLTSQSRIRQRSLTKEPKKYVDSLVQYLTNTEVLVLEGQKAIAAKIGVTAKKMEESENTLMEKGLAQNLLLIQSALRTRVKESLVPEKEASLEQAKTILNFQVAELKNKTQYFKNLFGGLQKTPQNFQLIPMLLALALNDLVFEQYNLQEEDFMKNVSDNVIMTNPEIMNIFREMQTAIIKLMQELGIISPEASQYMQTQSQIPNNQAPQFPNGLPPGVNPMELLQMQQYEQFQKLMQQQQPK